MCGIIGYSGKRKALPIILDGLTRMEYRGYDSAGVAILEDNSILCVKARGKVSSLKEKCVKKPSNGTTGIGHTRWATHGKPSEINSHPHTDCSGDFFLVHNGIIENYRELKNRLKKKHKFVSDTDTEVITHLIEEKYQGNFKEAVRLALKELRGTFGIAAISRHDPDTLVAARFGSPLILGIGKEEYVIASDASAILPTTNSVVYLKDGDLVTVGKDSYEISDFKTGNEQEKNEPTKIPWSAKDAEQGGFPHFMIKEIFEQPESLLNTMRGRIIMDDGTVKFGGLETFEEQLRSLKRLIVVGMGTARFTGLIGEYAIEELAGIPVKVEYGSEFSYRSAAIDKYTGLIAVSQSGESADTLNAVKEAKRRGMFTLGIVNVIGSSIAREVDAGIYNHVGPEIAVASTKASTSQVLLFFMLSIYLGRMRGLSKSKGQEILEEMQKLPAHISEILKNENILKSLSKKYKKYENFFFLGRKYNAGAAYEGALKLKECSYIHAEGCETSELKHGPISLISKNFPSVIIVPNDSMYEKSKTHIEEIKARGGPVIAIATVGNKEIAKIADDVVYIPKTLEMLTPIISFIPMQLFAYYMAVARGNDVDKPRNLAKSVTVE